MVACLICASLCIKATVERLTSLWEQWGGFPLLPQCAAPLSLHRQAYDKERNAADSWGLTSRESLSGAEDFLLWLLVCQSHKPLEPKRNVLESSRVDKTEAHSKRCLQWKKKQNKAKKTSCRVEERQWKNADDLWTYSFNLEQCTGVHSAGRRFACTLTLLKIISAELWSVRKATAVLALQWNCNLWLLYSRTENFRPSQNKNTHDETLSSGKNKTKKSSCWTWHDVQIRERERRN